MIDDLLTDEEILEIYDGPATWQAWARNPRRFREALGAALCAISGELGDAYHEQDGPVSVYDALSHSRAKCPEAFVRFIRNILAETIP